MALKLKDHWAMPLADRPEIITDKDLNDKKPGCKPVIRKQVACPLNSMTQHPGST